jgi:2-dehydro-3-deoxygluconokinase
MESSHIKQFAAIGEAMIELSHQDVSSLKLAFAGDTLNTTVYLTRLAQGLLNTYYVTALGVDPYSDQMIQTWEQEGINTSLIERFSDKLPGLYLIRTDHQGERTFYFYRAQSAARELFRRQLTEQRLNHLTGMHYLYLSGIALAILDSDARERLWSTLEIAKQRGATIIFDTNYRPILWPDVETARSVIEKTLPLVDIALPTFSDEQMLFCDETPPLCAQRLRAYGIKEIVIKCGGQACFVHTSEQEDWIPAQHVETIVDTTGAGDSFNAGYLAARLLHGKTVKASTEFGHRLAAIVITHPGAIIGRTQMSHLF